MSYLAGPLTRRQVAALMDGHPDATGATATAAGATTPASPAPVPATGDDGRGTTPVLPTVAEGVVVRWLHPSAPWGDRVGAVPGSPVMRPALAVRVRLTYDERKGDILHHQEWEAVVPVADRADVEAAVHVDYDDRDLTDTAPEGATYVLPEARLDTTTLYSKATGALREHLRRTQTLAVAVNGELGLFGRPGETDAEFAARCDAAAEARADEETARLRDRYRARIDAARKRFEKADRRVSELEADVAGFRQDELMSGAETIIDIFAGRASTRSASQAARRRGATVEREGRLASAKESALSEWDAMAALDAELAAELAEIDRRWSEAAGRVEHMEVRLEESDIHVDQLALLWIPS